MDVSAHLVVNDRLAVMALPTGSTRMQLIPLAHRQQTCDGPRCGFWKDGDKASADAGLRHEALKWTCERAHRISGRRASDGALLPRGLLLSHRRCRCFGPRQHPRDRVFKFVAVSGFQGTVGVGLFERDFDMTSPTLARHNVITVRSNDSARHKPSTVCSESLSVLDSARSETAKHPTAVTARQVAKLRTESPLS